MTQSNAPDENPYQSPFAEAGPVEPLPRFVLKEPIEVEGVKTVEDTLRAIQEIRGVTWRTHGCLVVLIMVVSCVTASLILPQRWLLAAGGTATLALVVLYFYWMLYRAPRHSRSQLNEIIGSGQFEKYAIGNDGLSYELALSRGVQSWERFSSYREVNGLLLIRLLDFPDVFVIPRSFCQREDHWQTILDLLASKLPLWEAGKPPPKREIPEQALAAIVESETPSDPDTIGASGQLTPRQLRRIVRLVTPSWFLRYFSWIAGITFCLLIWLAWRMEFEIDRPIPFVMGLFAMIAIVIQQRREQRKAWKQQRGSYEWQTWEITHTELHVTTPTASIFIPWRSVGELIRRESLAILKLTNRTFLPLPRSYFRSADDWDRFLSRAEAQIRANTK